MSDIRVLKGGEVYRYLGVEQSTGPAREAVKLQLKRTLLRRLKIVWSSYLTARQKVELTNTWAASVYHYYLPLWQWTRRELTSLTRQVRNVMRRKWAHQFGSSVLRFHLSRELGGKGIMSFVNLYERALMQTACYLRQQTGDSVLQAVVAHQTRVAAYGGWSLLKEADQVAASYGLNLQDMGHQSLRDLKDLQMEKRCKALKAKKLHGVFFNELEKEGQSMSDCIAWMKANMSSQTEGFVMAAQDGVIYTRGYRHQILKAKIDPRCKYGCCKRETVSHILSGCKTYNFTLY